jgi:hypothetical protein
MSELFLMIVAVAVMYRVGESEGQSGVIWGGLTVLACVGSVFVLPSLPCIRVIIVLVVMFAAMTMYRVLANK